MVLEENNQHLGGELQPDTKLKAILVLLLFITIETLACVIADAILSNVSYKPHHHFSSLLLIILLFIKIKQIEKMNNLSM